MSPGNSSLAAQAEFHFHSDSGCTVWTAQDYANFLADWVIIEPFSTSLSAVTALRENRIARERP